jgi:hypothetical protein
MLMTKKDHTRKKNGLHPPKIAESDTVSLGHGLCGSDGSIYNKDTSQNTPGHYQLAQSRKKQEL